MRLKNVQNDLTLFRLGGGEVGGIILITHERWRLQCSYFVTFPQIYLGTIWCCQVLEVNPVAMGTAFWSRAQVIFGPIVFSF